MTKKNQAELLRKIKNEVINFKESPLYGERIKNNSLPVVGEGSHRAKIMLVGEAPGKNEAATGRPFCGAAGKVLDALLNSAGIKRQNVYITNIVKDRPPFNRDPLPDEIEAYGPFLDRQINIIQPRVIVALGRFSMKYIMEKFKLENFIRPISRIHAKPFGVKIEYGEITIISLYHPAVALYNGNMKNTLLEDFKQLKNFT